MKKHWSHHDHEREKEKQRLERRLAWMKQQEEEKEHERRKRKKIEEYERKRAEQLKLAQRSKSRRTSRSTSRNRSRSRSKEAHKTSQSLQTTARLSRSRVMSERLNTMDNNKPLFQGPGEVQKYNENELRKVIVKIDRKIPEAVAGPSDIRRDVLNPEEIMLKRREGEQLNNLIQVLLTKKRTDVEVNDTKMELDIDGNNNGEGLKPIFDREELKSKPLEIEEHRTIQAIGRDSPVKRSQAKRRSVSSSPRRHRSPSSNHSSSFRFRSNGSSRHHSDDHHHKYDSRHRSRTRDNSREDSKRRRTTSRGRSHSRDRDYVRSDREYSRKSRSESEYRERRGRSQDRNYERQREDASRERMIPAPYVQQVPYPIYYQDYHPARPMMIGPGLPPMPPRGPVMRGRIPMAPIRPPFPPRFVGPQEMYRNPLPPDPRYRPTY